MQLPVTVCVVCYGNHVDLARRFLESLYANTQVSHFSLRAGLNAVDPATLALFRNYSERHGNIQVFVEEQNTFKNPLMRRMFNEKPLETKWTIWCDDDTYFTEPDWLQRLNERTQDRPEITIWGHVYVFWRNDQLILDWIQKATWYRSLEFKRSTDGRANGAVEFLFATGGYWAARTEALQSLDWPDPRLRQAAEDYMLGEALRQNGFKIGDFHHGVKINDAPRRNAEAAEVRDILFETA